MHLNRTTRALKSTGPLVLAALWLLVVWSQLHLAGGLTRGLALLAVLALLMFVVERSSDVCRGIALRVRALPAFLFTAVSDEEPSWVSPMDCSDFDEPDLPSRFQRPPPLLAL